MATIRKPKQRTSQREKQPQVATSAKCYIPLPEEFLGIDGEPWTWASPTEVKEMGFLEVLIHTCRFMRLARDNPPQGDVERLRDLVYDFQYAMELEHAEVLEMRQSDFDWLVSQFKDHGKNAWNPVDMAHLYGWLEKHVQKDPLDDDEAAESI